MFLFSLVWSHKSFAFFISTTFKRLLIVSQSVPWNTRSKEHFGLTTKKDLPGPRSTFPPLTSPMNVLPSTNGLSISAVSSKTTILWTPGMKPSQHSFACSSYTFIFGAWLLVQRLLPVPGGPHTQKVLDASSHSMHCSPLNGLSYIRFISCDSSNCFW